MSEHSAIANSAAPVTIATLRQGLSDLGVRPGMLVVVHSSLSRLGWVSGGAQAVVEALLSAVSESGTVVVPTHSSGLSDPSGWQNPPVPESWWPVIRSSMPAYDQRLTHTRDMGAIVECFRHIPGVRRSNHPTLSFAARGPLANKITADHKLSFPLGEDSPLARVYELDGHVLLLGVDYDNNTSLHLAEHRANYPDKRVVKQGAPMLVDGVRQWVEYQEYETNIDDFVRIGKEFTATGKVRSVRVGAGSAQLMKQRELVDYATEWMSRYRRS